MTKKGKAPTLISGIKGKPRIVVAKGKRHCKRCECELPAKTKCIEIPIPGSLGSKTYCCDCVMEMIVKSRQDLDVLEQTIRP